MPGIGNNCLRAGRVRVWVSVESRGRGGVAVGINGWGCSWGGNLTPAPVHVLDAGRVGLLRLLQHAAHDMRCPDEVLSETE